MFSHIFVGADDVAASKRFYDAALGALGIPQGAAISNELAVYRTPTGTFGIKKPINGQPASAANGGTIGFAAESPAEVEAWHAAGVGSGGTSCEDPPGERKASFGRIYTAYLRDPAGNKLCAIYRYPSG